MIESLQARANFNVAVVGATAALVVAALGLVPVLNQLWFGGTVLALTAILLVFQAQTIRLLARDHRPENRSRVATSLLGVLPVAAYAAAGALGLAGSPAALGAAAGGAVLSIVAAVIVSWVALVEVLR